MSDLRTRFGGLVAAHRRRIGITQEALADRAGISVDMVSKIEGGATGARFPVIERLADALGVDPAELFTTEIPAGAIKRGPLVGLIVKLSRLSPADQRWIDGVVEAVLRDRS